MLNKFNLSVATMVLLCGPTGAFANSGSKEFSRADSKEVNKISIVSANRDSDIETTRQIRSHLVSDDSLSLYGKNVSIVTLNGTVTLRGTVDSEQEKANVERHTLMVVKNENIRNQIRVAPLAR